MRICIHRSVSAYYGKTTCSSIRTLASVLGAALVLTAARPSLAQISIPHLGGGDPLADAKEKIEEDLFVKTATKLLGDQLPINLDASAAYPTVDVLPGAPFALQPLPFTPNTLNNPLPPGDYTINVMAFCTEYSVHRPGAGVAYKLAPLEGKEAGAVATLLWRGVQAGVAPQHLMGVAWGIQSGLTYDRMPKTFQATIDSLIPDYKSQLNGDFMQQLEDAYQAVAKEAKLPPLDALLLKMGDPGRLALAAEVERNALLAADKSDELREQTLFAGQENGVYTPVKAEDGPWTVRIPGVAYMRYRIVGGNLHDDNVIEIRVLPQMGSQARVQRRSVVLNASFAQGESSSAPQAPSLLGIMGVQQSADGQMTVNGMIGYSQGQGAQALIPVLPKFPQGPQPPAGPQPRILFGGNDVTNGQEQVVVGQKIELTTSIDLPQDVTITQQSWSVPGERVGDFVVTADRTTARVLPPVLDDSSTKFYFVDSPATVTVTYSCTLSNGQTASASTEFIVGGPTSPQIVVTKGDIQASHPILSSSYTLHFPIQFVGESTPSLTYHGRMEWVQVVDSDVATKANPTAKWTCSSRGLDGFNYPYPATNLLPSESEIDTNDDPGIPLDPNYPVSTAAMSFHMFLMWTPDLQAGDSIPVPFGSVTWSWASAANYDKSDNSWSKVDSTSTSSFANFTIDRLTFPQWSRTTTFQKGDCLCVGPKCK